MNSTCISIIQVELYFKENYYFRIDKPPFLFEKGQGGRWELRARSKPPALFFQVYSLFLSLISFIFTY